jgi:drug/metabolite transporter (DMT)-like permease
MPALFAGLMDIGPSIASILSTFEPVATTALTSLVVDEFLTPDRLLGGLLVLSSVAVVQWDGLIPAQVRQSVGRALGMTVVAIGGAGAER